MQQANGWRKARRDLASDRFFKLVLALFGLESLYVALSAGYPMVFDENTQFGLIKLYAHHLGPLFMRQPPNAAFAGPLAAEPSYLYQWLMSFPYRLLSALTSSQTIQIIGLRVISIALFGLGLVLFRRLLLRVKVPPAAANLSLLILILLPVVPLLAGQINYDNLVMPVTALALLLAVDAGRALRQNRLPVTTLTALGVICLLGSLVQFEFLPILVAIVAWMSYLMWHQRRRLQWRRDTGQAWHSLRRYQRAALLLGIVVSLGLFLEMYGVNVVRYHNPTPSCSQVLSAQTCSGYAPWQRDQTDLQHKAWVSKDPVRYGVGWLYRMLNELFYTSSGGASPEAHYLSVNPLPVPFVTAGLFVVVGVVLLAGYGRRLAGRYPELSILCAIAVFYGLLLLLRNYQDYLHIGQKIAINGRYSLPVLLPVVVALLLAYAEFLKRFAAWAPVAISAVFVVLMLQGGGALTYLVVSNTYWYWPASGVIRFNHDAQRLVRPLIADKTPLGPT